MNIERTPEAQRGFDLNGAALDPYASGGRYVNPEGAMAQEPVSMDYKTGQLRDMAEQEGLADVFPDEGNFVLGALNRLVDENAYTKDQADEVLLAYVKRYMTNG